MIDRIEKARNYLVGYCIKQASCSRCRFADENGGCTLESSIPANWPQPKTYHPRLVGFERNEE